MHESSGLQFFRSTTGIQSGLDVLDRLRLVMTSLTNSQVSEIIQSFKLVLERIESQEMLESFNSYESF